MKNPPPGSGTTADAHVKPKVDVAEVGRRLARVEAQMARGRVSPYADGAR